MRRALTSYAVCIECQPIMAQIDIGKLRKSLGDGDKPLSQAELAKRVGVNQATISRWETGEDEPSGPAAILLTQIAEQAGASA